MDGVVSTEKITYHSTSMVLADIPLTFHQKIYQNQSVFLKISLKTFLVDFVEHFVYNFSFY